MPLVFAIQEDACQSAGDAVTRLAPRFALLPAERGVVGVMAVAAVQPVVAGDIAGAQAGAEVEEAGGAAGRNAVGGHRDVVAVVLTGARVGYGVALGALVVLVGVLGGVLCQCPHAVALVAGCGVHVAVVMAVDTAGAVGGHVGGKLPAGYDRFPGTGSYPFRIIMATEAGG